MARRRGGGTGRRGGLKHRWGQPRASSNLALGTNPAADEERREKDDALRAAIGAHFTAIGRDEDEAGAIDADDAVLESVQRGERIVGKDSIIATRKVCPGRPAAFSVERVSGAGSRWAAELILRVGGEDPHLIAAILDVQDGQVIREALYIAEPREAPAAYRAPWVAG